MVPHLGNPSAASVVEVASCVTGAASYMKAASCVAEASFQLAARRAERGT